MKNKQKKIIKNRKEKNVLKELFGASKSSEDTDKIIKRTREGLKSKWMS